MTLHSERIGTGPRIVMAHGFTQNRNCWGPLAQDLARDHEVIVVDCPGHGESAHDDSGLWDAGRLLVEVGGAATYVGYSMGGRVALHAALASSPSVSSAVRRLVLIGATAGIDDADNRAERRQKDSALADRLLSEDLSVFIDSWLALPLFAGLTDETACRDQRLENRPAGLAASLMNCGTGTQEPLWDRLGELRSPLLVLAGQGDSKFAAIGRRIVQEAVNAEAELQTPEGTHAIHLEQPAVVANAIRAFIANH